MEPTLVAANTSDSRNLPFSGVKSFLQNRLDQAKFHFQLGREQARAGIINDGGGAYQLGQLAARVEGFVQDKTMTTGIKQLVTGQFVEGVSKAEIALRLGAVLGILAGGVLAATNNGGGDFENHNTIAGDSDGPRFERPVENCEKVVINTSAGDKVGHPLEQQLFDMFRSRQEYCVAIEKDVVDGTMVIYYGSRPEESTVAIQQVNSEGTTIYQGGEMSIETPKAVRIVVAEIARELIAEQSGQDPKEWEMYLELAERCGDDGLLKSVLDEADISQTPEHVCAAVSATFKHSDYPPVDTVAAYFNISHAEAAIMMEDIAGTSNYEALLNTPAGFIMTCCGSIVILGGIGALVNTMPR